MGHGKDHGAQLVVSASGKVSKVIRHRLCEEGFARRHRTCGGYRCDEEHYKQKLPIHFTDGEFVIQFIGLEFDRRHQQSVHPGRFHAEAKFLKDASHGMIVIGQDGVESLELFIAGDLQHAPDQFTAEAHTLEVIIDQNAQAGSVCSV